MIYDGECGFCLFWIRRWERLSAGLVDYVPFQDPRVVREFPELPREDCESSVQLVEPDGQVYSGAEAALRVLGVRPRYDFLLENYYHWPFVSKSAEWAYAFVARNRRVFSFLTRLAWGKEVAPPTYRLVRSIFLRAFGLIYLGAFVSLWVQVIGLIGEHGVIPAHLTLAALQQEANKEHAGLRLYHALPTFSWFGASDNSLKLQCAAGAMLSILLIIGIAPAPCLFLLWAVYLSLATVCREFLSFQWDYLLLEAGWLAIFFAPLQIRPRWSAAAPPSRIVLWLLRFLLFRLMFESGCVKLLSHDASWRELTALNFHYETQPLPTWVGWYAHQLPASIQKFSVIVMFGTELVIPFLIFAPRRPRQFASFALIGLQVLIFATGNYCFFNLLTIALCFLLFDDAFLQKFMPARRWPLFPAEDVTPKGMGWPRLVTLPLLCLVLLISALQLSSILGMRTPWPRPLIEVYRGIEPFRSLNTYGLFTVMTTNRPEIVIEGSNDGQEWRAYEFKYKPGDVNRRPGFVAPHQPRLDWQMWFAALGRYERNPWLINFSVRLLEGAPEVLSLLDRNPFPTGPPRYVRAIVYEYQFSDFALRRKTGDWWRRELKGPYMPVLSLRRPDEIRN
jgi:predicted DCC family thiol-disulfide oxidoreductase YuxK